MTTAELSFVGRLATPDAALKFIFAGNAYFTLRSAKTGTRYTYRVRQALSVDEGQSHLPLPELARQNVARADANPKYFVSLLAGPENTTDYVYLGMIAHGEFRLTRASKMTKDSTPVKAFSWMFKQLQANRMKMPADLEMWHEGRCGRCGRMLTVPESIEAGLGPDCAGRMQ